MRSQKSIVRKAQKARNRIKDFVKRANINKNVPNKIVIDKREKFAPAFVSVTTQTYSGSKTINVPKYHPGTNTPVLKHTGYKDVKRKLPLYRHHYKNRPHDPLVDDSLRRVGMIQYPKRRKMRAPKKSNLLKLQNKILKLK